VNPSEPSANDYIAITRHIPLPYSSYPNEKKTSNINTMRLRQPHVGPIFTLLFSLSANRGDAFPSPSLLPQRSSATSLFYKVYGAPEDKQLETVRENLNVPTEDKLYEVKFRHWDWVMQLKQQSREADGTVSMAGTGWEACNVLAD
jgi:hypothetical protein